MNVVAERDHNSLLLGSHCKAIVASRLAAENTLLPCVCACFSHCARLLRRALVPPMNLTRTHTHARTCTHTRTRTRTHTHTGRCETLSMSRFRRSFSDCIRGRPPSSINWAKRMPILSAAKAHPQPLPRRHRHHYLRLLLPLPPHRRRLLPRLPPPCHRPCLLHHYRVGYQHRAGSRRRVRVLPFLGRSRSPSTCWRWRSSARRG